LKIFRHYQPLVKCRKNQILTKLSNVSFTTRCLNISTNYDDNLKEGEWKFVFSGINFPHLFKVIYLRTSSKDNLILVILFINHDLRLSIVRTVIEIH
jgi:hypothetical protein